MTGEEMPPVAIVPMTLGQAAATVLYAALDPSLAGESFAD
jgi:hypothetical protein